MILVTKTSDQTRVCVYVCGRVSTVRKDKRITILEREDLLYILVINDTTVMVFELHLQLPQRPQQPANQIARSTVD